MVTDSVAETAARDEALDVLLRDHPEAIVAALAGDGFRVPMPATVGLPDRQVIPVPADRATMVDLVIPADAMKVITAWERAVTRGLAIETVRTREAPDRPVGLSFIDVRHRHGVWLAAFIDPECVNSPAGDGALLPASLLIPLRPRTATIRKTYYAIIMDVDDRTSRMLGWTAQQMVGQRSIEFVHPDDQERAVANWMEMLSKQESQRVRLRHRCADGGWLWVETENVLHPADDPAEVVVVTQLSDISDEMAAHDALYRREKLFHRITESLPIGLLQLAPDGSLEYANEPLARILGVETVTTLDEVLATAVEEDRARLTGALTETLEHGTDNELEVNLQPPKTRGERRCAVTLIALGDQEAAPGLIACFNDITESARMREELRAKATFDVLTGCYNRASVMAAVDQALRRDDTRQVGVIFVDLDEFKLVNDTLGHAAGDELLVNAANRLAGLLRDDDIVGRIGGDEFLIVCRGLREPAEAVAIAERVREALHGPVPLAAGIVDLRASIGVACSTPDATSDTLIANADTAMYESKRGGTGRPVLYSDRLRQPAEGRAAR